LMSESSTAPLTAGIATQMAEQGSRVVVLSSANAVPGSAVKNDRELHLPLCSVAPELAPICEILPLEILAVRLAERLGRDPGRLPQKVTREE
jgi:fructoselysine-6-P-deglycase FrlB-like protein